MPSTPFYSPADPGSDDPFFHIHTNANRDGFFLAFEMYTTGYGGLWTGELGEMAISCAEPLPGANSTGIRVHFVPEPGGEDLNGDFTATATITITQLDDAGYNILVEELSFSDGSSIVGLHMTG